MTARRRDDLALVEIGMRFDLQDGDRFACEFDRFFNHGDIKIGDADMLG